MGGGGSTGRSRPPRQLGAGGEGRRGGPAPRRASQRPAGVQPRVRRIPRLHARRGSALCGLERLRAHRPAVRQTVRGRNEHAPGGVGGRERVHGCRWRKRRRAFQTALRRLAGRGAGLLGGSRARRRGIGDVRRRSARLPTAAGWRNAAASAVPPSGRAAGGRRLGLGRRVRIRRPAFGQTRHPRRHLGFLLRAGGVRSRRAGAWRSRSRSDDVPCARSGGAGTAPALRAQHDVARCGIRQGDGSGRRRVARRLSTPFRRARRGAGAASRRGRRPDGARSVGALGGRGA